MLGPDKKGIKRQPDFSSMVSLEDWTHPPQNLVPSRIQGKSSLAIKKIIKLKVEMCNTESWKEKNCK